MNRPAPVTVVTPTHRRPKLVVEAVSSVMAQDYPGPIELIVVFDGADPHPIEVEVPENRSIEIVYNSERTPGLCGARNTGILRANGEYIAFLDDDDAWRPSKLRAQLELLDRFGKDAVVSTGKVIFQDDPEDPLDIWPGPDGKITLQDALRRPSGGLQTPSAMLYPARLLTEEIGLLDEEIPGSYMEDLDMLLRALHHVPLIAVREPLTLRRMLVDSNYVGNWEVIADGIEYMLDKHAEFQDIPEGLAVMEGRRAFALAAQGRRREAVRAAWTALRARPGEKRAWGALGVAAGMPPSWPYRIDPNAIG